MMWMMHLQVNQKSDYDMMTLCIAGVRSAMRAASQLPGKGPNDVDDAPAG